jgi:hypothetical protein
MGLDIFGFSLMLGTCYARAEQFGKIDRTSTLMDAESWKTMALQDEEFKFANSYLEDIRKLIAAGKAQRWDVTKWVVGLNAGLATASIAINQKTAACGILGISILLALIGIALVIVYSSRMTSARNDALGVYEWLTKAGIPCQQIGGSGRDWSTRRTWKHDKPEIMTLVAVICLSCIPSFIAWIFIPLSKSGTTSS